jgi:glycosyltransferase involved in cell wall biosynthesis
MRSSARLSIGMPVRNGERYLREAAGSLLAQTHGDFELLISDNASTDATPQICEQLARSDPRVRWVRHPVNLGAAKNFNFVFRSTRGELFKWAAHDDLCDRRLLERCVARLESEPRAVLCHAASQWVDARGAAAGPVPCPAGLSSDRPSERFIAALEMGYPAIIWGVMRREAVEATGLIGGFVNADRYFLAELLLRGPAVIVPEVLFSVRRHEGSFTDDFYRLAYRERLAWFNPRRSLRGLVPMAAAGVRLGRRLASDPMPLRERGTCAAYLARRVAGFAGRRAAEAFAFRDRRTTAAARPPGFARTENARSSPLSRPNPL